MIIPKSKITMIVLLAFISFADLVQRASLSLDTDFAIYDAFDLPGEQNVRTAEIRQRCWRAATLAL